jgi:diacylglycerol kinase (ATP)
VLNKIAKVIVNPTAGANSTHKKWPDISSLLKQSGLRFDFQFTEDRGHAIEIANEAASDGYRHLVAVGGDGTIHEVANGILQSKNSSSTILGVINTGTGGDLIKSIGIHMDYIKACGIVNSPNRLLMDVGVVTYQKSGQTLQRFFVNSAGVGFDARVVDATEKLPKWFGGTIPYLTALFRTFIGYRNETAAYKIGDSAPEEAKILSLVVANGGYFGGGMHIAPEAKLNDGLLDVVVMGNFGKFEILKNLSKVYRGTHSNVPKVKMNRSTEITVESQHKLILQADGEVLGETPASFTILPKSLNLVI